MNIQNHFSDTALLSLAELKTRLEQDCKLDARGASAIHLPSLEQMFRTLSEPRLATD